MAFKWKEFIKTALGISLIGVGIAFIGNYPFKIIFVIIGFIFIGLGIATLFTEDDRQNRSKKE